MAVTLENTRLWQVQENKSESQGNVRIDSIYSQDSDETLLTGLESQEKLTLTGETTGLRLSRQSGYSDDPLTALAEWVAEMETYVNGEQGSGWSLTDNERGDTKNVVVEMFGWQREAGQKYSVRWDLSAVWANGMMPSTNTPADSVNPKTSGTATLDGNDLGSIKSWRQQKKQQIEVYPIALADPGENEVLSKSGAFRQIILTGTKEGTQSERNDFDDAMQNLIGQDTIVDYVSAFPGRTKQVMVKNYESTREAGLTRIGEYGLELIEGIN